MCKLKLEQILSKTWYTIINKKKYGDQILHSLITVVIDRYALSRIIWEHENPSSLSVPKFTLNYTKIKLYIFWQKYGLSGNLA